MYRVLFFFLFTILAQQPTIYFEQIPSRRTLYADCANEIKIFSKCTTCSELMVTATNAEVLKTEKEETYLVVPNKRGDLGWGVPQPLPVTLYVKYSYKDSLHVDSLVFENVEEPPTPLVNAFIDPKIIIPKAGAKIERTLDERLRAVTIRLIKNDDYFSNFCSSDTRYIPKKIEVKIINQKNRKREKQIAVIDNRDIVDLWAFLKNENLKKYNLVAIRCLSFYRMNFRGKLFSYELPTN